MAKSTPVQIDLAMSHAVMLYQSGRLHEASTLCQQVLQSQPRHFAALNLLGVIAARSNLLEQAVELFTKATRIDRKSAATHNNLGNAQQSLRQYAAAVASYDKAIALKRDYVDAHTNRGHALRALLKHAEALASYEKAIKLDPRSASAHYSRGNALCDLGQHSRAIACYDNAVALKADYVDAHYNRGNALLVLKQYTAAVASYDRAIALKSDHADAYYNRGNALVELKQYTAAVASYDEAIALKRDYREAWHNRGKALCELRQFDAAIASYDTAIAHGANRADAYCDIGFALQQLDQLDAALEKFAQAISIQPAHAQAYTNQGVVFLQLNHLEAALEKFDRAISIDPTHAQAYTNQGVVFLRFNHLEAALASYDKAIALKPDFVPAYQNRGHTRLLAGDYTNGWADHEHRLKSELFISVRRDFRLPRWDGAGSIAGKTILLHSEQGLGDTLQFCRYTKLVADLGARVILEVQTPLQSLLGSLEGVAEVLPYGAALPEFDFHCSLMSLPFAFKTTLPTIPAQIPYLHADGTKVSYWREKVGEKRKPRVGLVWSGGFRPDHPELRFVNNRRNIPLKKLAQLYLPDVEFYTLQKGQPAESELADLSSDEWGGPKPLDYTNLLNDFSDTAALIESLDLIIAVDTSTAHLAAALGKPVWLLNRFDTCWRWLLDRTDSPWYPTIRIYRQPEAGDWDGVIETVKSDLSRFTTEVRKLP